MSVIGKTKEELRSMAMPLGIDPALPYKELQSAIAKATNDDRPAKAEIIGNRKKLFVKHRDRNPLIRNRKCH
ncbi:hypothetical protein ACFQ1M_09790 [Sungkyunkwania multivorans]|uniref:Uncharacterized protein n=1 Tax=Sungkyunkwania multivorans TaxID=1173618 RepID=A0ABW3CXI5_9FLAO